ncbi:MAG: hypothetical protein LAO31_19960 [Acidobacteriia bacterium]|nr:hypothetical protein [Terriglobia bacterium]
MREPWQKHAAFYLKNRISIKKVTVSRGEWLGVYQETNEGGKLLCTSQSPVALYHRLGRVAGICWPVLVRRAQSKEELPRSFQSKTDYFEWLTHKAFEAIAEARKRRSPDYPMHPKEQKAKEAAIKQAEDFLTDLANEARNKGSEPGDKPTREEIRKMLDIFDKLASGDTIKSVAIDEAGLNNCERKARALSVQLLRFATRVKEAVHRTCGPRSVNYLELFHALRDWPGLEKRRDGRALMEVAKRAGIPIF